MKKNIRSFWLYTNKDRKDRYEVFVFRGEDKKSYQLSFDKITNLFYKLEEMGIERSKFGGFSFHIFRNRE